MTEQYLLLRKKFASTKEAFIEKAKKIHGDKYDYSKVEYINAKTKVCIICPIHGEFWQTPDKHLIGQGCIKCQKTYKPSTREFKKKCFEKFGDLYDYSKVEYINKKTNVIVKCNKCGREFLVTPHNHLVHNEGCPYCRLSKMENSINKVLTENNICFEQQKVFDWLVNGKSVKRLDFYLPKYNIAIECQGLQHFKPIDYFGGEIYLKRQQNNDRIKRELCKEHNIDVLYYSDIKMDFPYDVITKTSDLMAKLKKASENKD